MKYISKRRLIDLMVGLMNGVGKHFGEELLVRKLNKSKVEIKFPYD